MERHEDPDPTCVIKMLDEFRSNSESKRQSILGGRFPFNIQSRSTTKPMRLNFDDSFCLTQNESGPTKKMKLYLTDDSVESSIDSSKVSESSVMASPWETRRLKAELAEAKATIASLETRSSKAHTLHRETVVFFEQEKNALQKTVENDRIKISQLEQRLKTVRRREAEAKEELERLQGEQRQSQLQASDRCAQLQVDNAQLRDQLAELEASAKEKFDAVELQLSKVQAELATTRSELADGRRLTEEMTSELREKRRELRQWDSDKAKLLVASQRIKDLEYERESHLEAYNLAQSQQTKLLRVSELEHELSSLREENKNLRQATTNTVYLEGLVEDLRHKLSQLEERERECVGLRVELGLAQGRLTQWAELHRTVLGHSPVQGPLALRRCIESMQQRELTLTQEKALAESTLKSLKESHNEKLNELQEAQSQLAITKKTVELQSTKIRRLRKQINLITWERDDLRTLVDSCQKEVTMTVACLEAQPAGHTRLEAMEKLVEGYQKRMAELEADPSLAVPDLDAGLGNIHPTSDKLEKLLAEKAALARERDALQKEVGELKIQMEYRSFKGDFDMRECKILHLRMNPQSDAEQRQQTDLEKAQTEVVRLRERVRLLEQGQTHDLTSIVNDRMSSTSTKEVEELKEKIKSHERQNQRLREVFKTTSHEFREAVYQLLGYKVDGLANKIYRLSSLYAEAPDDHLLFKMSGSGMELLETQFSASCAELIDLHLHQQRSIPVFLSAVTVDLYQRQTVSVH